MYSFSFNDSSFTLCPLLKLLRLSWTSLQPETFDIYHYVSSGRSPPLPWCISARSQKNVRHHHFSMEKNLRFEWPKTAQMALKFLFFSRIFLNMFTIFLFFKTIFTNLFLFTMVFSWKCRKFWKVQFKMTLYKLLY